MTAQEANLAIKRWEKQNRVRISFSYMIDGSGAHDSFAKFCEFFAKCVSAGAAPIEPDPEPKKKVADFTSHGAG